MKMKLQDMFTVDNVHRTNDGYLAAFARVARTGIQIYKGDEVGRPEMAEVRVYRPPSEVFHEDAMRSFAHRPVTLIHPKVPVTSRNWKKYSGGQTGDAVVRDGEFIRVPMVMMDQRLIDAYEKGGIKELSMGYSTDLKWAVDGKAPDGTACDAYQTNIRGNHLAVVPLARGGDMLRIGDESPWRAMLDKMEAESDGDEDENEEDQIGEYLSGDSVSLPKGKRVKLNDPGDYNHNKVGSVIGAHPTDPTRTRVKFGSMTTSHPTTCLSAYDAAPDYVSCPYCGANTSPDASQCPACGAYVSPTKDGVPTMKQILIDGVPVDVVNDQGEAIINRHISALTKRINDALADLEKANKEKKKSDTDMDDARSTISAKDGEIAVLKQQVKDAAVTPEKLDTMVKDRLSVITAAGHILDSKYVFDGKTVETIRRDAVSIKLGDAAKEMNDATIVGAFTALTADSVRGGSTNQQFASNVRASFSQQTHTTDAGAARDKAFAEST
jgi:hypothetical protein